MKLERFKVPGVKHRKGKPIGTKVAGGPISMCSIHSDGCAVNDTDVEARGFASDIRPGDVARSLLGQRVIGHA